MYKYFISVRRSQVTKQSSTQMASKMFPFKSLFFFSRALLRKLRHPRSHHHHRKLNTTHSSHFKLQRFPSLQRRSDITDQTIVFDVEGALLKSSSLFPYFMLVAFEAGGLLRTILLFLMYPFLCLIDEEMSLKVMVMVCFCGIERDSFRVGRAVLPKFFLEDVGLEGFQVLRRGRRKMGISGLPRVMVEGFLREYLEVNVVVGRELKVVNGYYVGLMEDKKNSDLVLEEIFGEEKRMGSDVIIVISGFNKLIDLHLFSHCKEIYMVSRTDKRSWNYLPKERYPKPLIFHDGRLAIKPTPLNTLAIFIWVPFGLFLAIIRTIVALTFPFKIACPLLTLLGLRLRGTKTISPISTTNDTKCTKRVLYVCNHRTLLDPLYLSAILGGTPITAVTYSLSRVSEILAPIKTVRLTRKRDQDAMMMDDLLSRGDLVICPEGTTCREPYLLRFSPLFGEMGDQIVPVAMDVDVSMFYGTTAGGFKCLDPLFFLMNPFPMYKVKVLEKRPGALMGEDDDGGESRLKVANQVQKELGEALGFECTKLTRKDKYLMLAGNEGVVKS